MPVFKVDILESFGLRILQAAGASGEQAKIVAQELAEANLVGHDSHGVMRLVQYVSMMEGGFIKLDVTSEILTESDSYAVIDGRFGFGQVAAANALPLAMSKARQTGTATVLMRNCNHLGRLGSYLHKAALDGFVGMMAVNSPGPGGVAPFGGIDRRIGTNPLCIAAPASPEPLVLDMTTSATAEGKLRVAFQKGESVPPGVMIDGYGNPSTNPADYYNKPYGAILPLGGNMGHKGFGLGVMIDVLCGILSGAGIAREDLPRGTNGVWLHLLDVTKFISRENYNDWMSKFIPHLKSSRLQPGVNEILLPGEMENRQKQKRQSEGIPIPEETWRQLSELAGRLKVSVED